MTSVIDVRAWWPLILPQVLFRDKRGEPDAFIETNPALHIEPDGSFILLVRLINYRKFFDRSYKVGSATSLSLYHICHGRMSADGVPLIEKRSMLKVANRFPKYATVWFGYEDIRFLNSKQIIITYPELNPNGNARLVLADLSGCQATITTLLEPSRIEKNWMPFRAGATDFVIYSVTPLAIKRLCVNDVTVVSSAADTLLAGYHGSSNGVPLDDGAFLFLIHVFRDRTTHRWLRFDPARRRYGISDEFVFLADSYIEFTCSLCVWNGACYVGLGVNDDKAFITRVDMPNTEKFLYFEF